MPLFQFAPMLRRIMYNLKHSVHIHFGDRLPSADIGAGGMHCRDCA